MSLAFYKLLHFSGIFLTFTALGGQILYVATGGDREDKAVRRSVAMLHGVGVIALLVGGFGMNAKLGLEGFPFWFVAKVALWAILASLLMVPWRMPQTARWLWWGLPVLGILGAAAGIYKPTL